MHAFKRGGGGGGGGDYRSRAVDKGLLIFKDCILWQAILKRLVILNVQFRLGEYLV